MKPLTRDEFIRQARKVHGIRYTYDLAVYKNYHKPIRIKCKRHGIFLLSPAKHVSGGRGCQACGLERRTLAKRLAPSEFIGRAKKVHRNFYDYSKTRFVHFNEYVEIICPLHGKFRQRPINHILGRGCWECAKRKISTAQGLTQSAWITKARQVHGDHYNYRLVKYFGAGVKVRIICPKHGPFLQSPTSHTQGIGCAGCADYGFNTDKPALLYYIRLEGDGHRLWKIGITNRSVTSRFSGLKVLAIKTLKIWKFKRGIDAYLREQKLIKKFARHLYMGRSILPGVSKFSRELFTRDVLGLDK